MRLLICTQAVDLDDPVLGFFHRWIAEFAKRCDSVHVICLKEGRHDLPENVVVHSLGKESGPSRFKYVSRFYRYLQEVRGEYDAVFVHMNPEYVLLGGIWWRFRRKRVALWYIHPTRPWQLRCAIPLTDVVCTSQENSMRVRTDKKRVLGHGIDTEFFSPPHDPPKQNSILFLGRIDPVKHVDAFVGALEKLHGQGMRFHADIIGSPTEPASEYAHDVRNLAAPLSLDGVITMRAAVPNDEARELFRSHAIYCNLTPSGSFDKTILEAMACGSLCVVANDAFRAVLPEALVVSHGTGAERALGNALELPEGERVSIVETCRTYVVKNHSLSRLVEKIMSELRS